MNKQNLLVLLRDFVIELIVYGLLVVTYAAVVLRLLSKPLARLFHNNLVVYAFATLGLIVVQGALLDVITSFILNQLRLERLE